MLAALFGDAQLLARAVEHGLGADGSFVAVNNRVSQSVPHLHVHVVPRRFKDGLRGFFWPRNPYRDDAACGRGPSRAEGRRGRAFGLGRLRRGMAKKGRDGHATEPMNGGTWL